MAEVANPLLTRTGPARRVAVALSVIALGLWLAVAIPAAWVQALDDQWHDAMAARATDVLLGIARVLSVVGSTWVSVPLAVLVALWLLHQRSWMRLRVWVGAVLPSYAVTLAGKTLYARPRPDDRLLEVPTASFPSAHATDAAVLALTLVLVFVPPGGRRRPWLLLAIGYALVQAWSRTYLRVHWLSDVSAGVRSLERPAPAAERLSGQPVGAGILLAVLAGS